MNLTRQVWMRAATIASAVSMWLVTKPRSALATASGANPIVQKQTQLAWIVEDQDLAPPTALAAWQYTARTFYTGNTATLPRLLLPHKHANGSLTGWLVGTIPRDLWMPYYRETGAQPLGLLRLQVSRWDNKRYGWALRQGWIVQLLQVLEVPIVRLPQHREYKQADYWRITKREVNDGTKYLDGPQ